MDVRIHQLDVRFRRRGGWSWGSDPTQLLDALARALPALVASELASMVAERSGRIESLDVAIPVRFDDAELVRIARTLGTGATRHSRLPRGASVGPVRIEPEVLAESAPRLRALVRRRLEEALRNAVIRSAPNEEEEESASRAAHVPPAEIAAASAERERLTDRARLLRALSTWKRHGALHRAVSALPEDVVRRFIDRLALDVVASSSPAPARSDRELSMALEAARQPAPHRPSVECLIALVELSSTEPALAAGDAKLVALRRAMLAREEAAPRREHVVAKEHAGLPAPPTRRARGEIVVASALPFLVLAVLARMGWLETAALLVAEMAGESALPAFAVALAYKLLSPPHKGWLRSEDDKRAAAAFAGLHEPLAEGDVVELARRLGDGLAPADELLRAILGANRGEHASLLSTRAPHGARPGWLVAEREGLFPLAWIDDDERVPPLGAPIWIPGSDARPSLLERMRSNSFASPIEARPEEPYRTLALGSARIVTNAPGDLSLLPLRGLDEDADRLRAAWTAVAVDRPSAVHARSTSLDRTLSLAVSVALAQIAWTLFGTREPTDAALTLERFADMGARVRFDERTVEARLPLGARYRDLQAHGLVGSVRGVPWLGDRSLELTSG